MPRRIANDRVLAVGRKPAIGRKQIGFINDGKIHIVLDTNVPINAIWALSKGINATPTEQDCLTIINLVHDNKISLGINSNLYKEYQDKASQHLATGKIKPEDMNYVMQVMRVNYAPFRMLVDPQRVSRDPDDDILFAGLAADYLISDNLKDVRPERLLKGIKTPYANTLSPSQFVALLREV